jgi:hypothetical protein
MARPLRVQFPGAIYHVMSRGNGRQKIFRDERDYGRFLVSAWMQPLTRPEQWQWSSYPGYHHKPIGELQQSPKRIAATPPGSVDRQVEK